MEAAAAPSAASAAAQAARIPAYRCVSVCGTSAAMARASSALLPLLLSSVRAAACEKTSSMSCGGAWWLL